MTKTYQETMFAPLEGIINSGETLTWRAAQEIVRSLYGITGTDYIESQLTGNHANLLDRAYAVGASLPASSSYLYTAYQPCWDPLGSLNFLHNEVRFDIQDFQNGVVTLNGSRELTGVPDGKPGRNSKWKIEDATIDISGLVRENVAFDVSLLTLEAPHIDLSHYLYFEDKEGKLGLGEARWKIPVQNALLIVGSVVDQNTYEALMQISSILVDAQREKNTINTFKVEARRSLAIV